MEVDGKSPGNRAFTMSNRGLRRFTNRCAFRLLLENTNETGRYVDAVLVPARSRNSLSIGSRICAVDICRTSRACRGCAGGVGPVTAAAGQLRRRLHRIPVWRFEPAVPAKIAMVRSATAPGLLSQRGRPADVLRSCRPLRGPDGPALHAPGSGV